MHDITLFLQHYGLVVVFLNLLVAQAGVPIPVFPTLLVAGALSATSGAPLGAVMAAAVAGSLIADFGWYTVAARVGRPVLDLLCRISVSPDSCVRRTEDLFGRFGPRALLFVRFVPGLRYITVAMAGIYRLNRWLFAVLDGVGATLYVAVPLALGRLFKPSIDQLLAALLASGRLGALVIVGVLAIYFLVKYAERRAFIRKLRMERVSVSELADMIGAGRTPVIFDVRSEDSRLRDGVIPGAVGANAEDMDWVLGKFPLETEIIIYCS
jgi:membrane protein DedA with SNARE-associated domain